MQTSENIKQYWDLFWTNRTEIGSQNDHLFQELSSCAITRFLKPNYITLNVGCGDGYAFNKYCEIVKKMIGMDYSQKAIDKANDNHKTLVQQGKAEFFIGDLLEVQNNFINKFDAVISERCLCNLDSEDKQKRALTLIGDYLKPDGIAIICEPSLQGYDSIDQIRSEFGLEPIKRHWHNLLVNEGIFSEIETLKVEERYTFGVYTLLSRLFYPIYIFPQEPKFDSDINKISAILCEKIMTKKGFKDIPSQHVLYILRRAK
ncbi:TPA: class I SAM-dependent methyltransferase [bacterium]|mgnify:CR=1 FL=1|nr:class I SAM-dependent methyltransferase [bacterium]